MIEILMIEDDVEFASFLSLYLEQYEMKITNYEDPYLALSCGVEKFDLVILDLGLEGMDGLDVCKELSKRWHIPIIISSARSDIDDKELGFENGASDYLPKPYDPKEMVIRIKSLLKRFRPQELQKKSRFSLHGYDLFFDGKKIECTKGEFEIISTLLEHFPNTVSREQIVYNSTSLHDSYGKTLNTIIGRIRSKTSQTCIEAVRGIGYRLVE